MTSLTRFIEKGMLEGVGGAMKKLIFMSFFNFGKTVFDAEFLTRSMRAFENRYGRPATMVEYSDIDLSDYRYWNKPGWQPDTLGLQLHATPNTKKGWILLKAWS